MDIVTLGDDLPLYSKGLFCILLVFFSLSVAVTAWAGQDVTFSWRANPVEDGVIGYRLYMGEVSRSTGTSYPYYVDFGSWELCFLQNGDSVCDPLPDYAVSCQDLDREIPTCTLHDIEGDLYYAMTAYSSTAESDFTQELFVPAGKTPTPGQLAVLQQVYSLLLTGKK